MRLLCLSILLMLIFQIDKSQCRDVPQLALPHSPEFSPRSDESHASPSSASSSETGILSPRFTLSHHKISQVQSGRVISPRKMKKVFEELISTWEISQSETIKLRSELADKIQESKNLRILIKEFIRGNAADEAIWLAASKGGKKRGHVRGGRLGSSISGGAVINTEVSSEVVPDSEFSLDELQNEEFLKFMQRGVAPKSPIVSSSEQSFRGRSVTLPEIISSRSIAEMGKYEEKHKAFGISLAKWEKLQSDKVDLHTKIERKQKEVSDLEQIITVLQYDVEEYKTIWEAKQQMFELLLLSSTTKKNSPRKKDSKKFVVETRPRSESSSSAPNMQRNSIVSRENDGIPADAIHLRSVSAPRLKGGKDPLIRKSKVTSSSIDTPVRGALNDLREVLNQKEDYLTQILKQTHLEWREAKLSGGDVDVKRSKMIEAIESYDLMVEKFNNCRGLLELFEQRFQRALN